MSFIAQERSFSQVSYGHDAEPMALSPMQTASPQNTSLQFVPEFLTGQARLSTARQSFTPIKQSPKQGSWSTLSSSHHQSPFAAGSQATPQKPFHPTASNGYSSPSLFREHNINEITPIKRSGPPVRELFDDDLPTTPLMNKQVSILKEQATMSTPNASKSSPLGFFKTIPSTKQSFLSPGQIDPFYTQGESVLSENDLDENWITVFGFQPASASYILQQFTNYGTILDHRMSSKGNWMHIRYQTKMQAKTALSKTGKIFSDSIMVGVTPCIDMKVMNQSKENSLLGATLNQSGLSKSLSRPLVYIPSTPGDKNNNTPEVKRLEQSKGLVSKAVDLIFSW